MSERLCIVEGCEKQSKTRAGYCGMHNERLRKHGDVNYVSVIVGDPVRRFWSKVDKTDTCWLWTGYRDVDGYGRFHLNGKPRMAHRYSWFLAGNGEVPDGLYIDHLCRVRNCVNPAHLEVVTVTENNRRSNCPTGLNYRKKNCPRCGSDFSVSNAGKRFCAPCLDEAHRRQTEERRARRAMGEAS